MANNLSLLTEELKQKIIAGILEDKPNIKIYTSLGVSEPTYYHWIQSNYKGLGDAVREAKKAVVLRETEQISKEIRNMSTIDEKGQQNPRLLAIKQKEAEFLRETLGKDQGYSKRLETIGLNINKNEPLDDEQRAKLDKLLRAVGNVVNGETEIVDVSQNEG